MSAKKKVDDDNSDPGASRYGNFINYYQFHHVIERVRQLPQHVWQSRHPVRKYIGLDVGCNAGDLTIALWQFLKDNLSSDIDVNVLGVDLDPVLIQRARESHLNSSVDFECLDFCCTHDRDNILGNYLKRFDKEKFDVIFCFSITMWIHLNHGDEGLVRFLEDICERAELVVIEPQLWKNYRNASRRLRRSGEMDFPLINTLKLTGDMVKHIENIVCGDKCRFEKITITNDNNWGRKVLIFRRLNEL
ncbi:hypothetical protein PV327_006799 [Microctonus hyperodae]|uniref:RNA methyltransferase n=1 Tax=Microctonus hyperodae TaxID=165561 RepID=A0AA39KIT0_MICHY|nr:hypothetical protein PV327_006799 [Microctonus hyperodae]